MRSEVIEADTIDAAAEQILNELSKDTTRRSSRSRENVIYFDGWDGLGASAVLRTVAQRLAASTSDEQPAPDAVQFHHIIHIDCSKWESRRAVQRAIAEQLKLPARVMEMLDRQDEDDDFHGLAEGSRAEIPQVVTEIYEFIQNHRFVVIFLNGSCEEVDLTKFGLPLYGYTSNKMLWTFRGRFRLNPRMEIDGAVKSTGVTDVFFTASRHDQDPQVHWSYLVHQEAADLIARKITDTAGGIMYSPAQVEDCFLYMLKLCLMTGGHHSIDYDLTTHGCNYWICDGIIQQGDDGDDGAWRAADDLQQEMRLDVECYHQYLSPHMLRRAETMPYWTSPSYGYLLSPANGDIFQHLNKPIDVLKLSHCSFSFSSPPFLCCHNLRFLWLEHCQDQAIGTDGAADKEQVIQRCFQRLWVLDVRYTRCDWILSARTLDFMAQLKELNVMGAQGWDMGQLQGRLPNIRKLRVTKSTVGCSNCSENNLILGMNKMELLEFSGNCTTMPGVANIPEMSTSNNCLETVIITDGCVGIQELSFKGCAKLKHILLSGLFEDLRILDLSGTAIKTLDLNAMIARNLDELFLDGCEKLCAILWPPEDRRKRHLQKLHIDTTQSAAASLLAPGRDEKSMEGRNTTTRVRRRSSASLSVAHGGRLPSEFYWCIWVRDARLLRSLVLLEKSYFNDNYVHMEISSPAVALGSASKEAVDSRSSMKQGKDNSTYTDVVDSFKDRMLLQASQGDGDAPTLTGICPCPDMPSLEASNCYMHMQDRGQPRSTESLQEGEETSTIITMPDLICRNARILHVHDSLSITSIPGHAPAMSSTWYRLRWCRVERCPKLGCVFTTPQLEGSGDEPIFFYLSTFWASQLPKARYIWNWSRTLAFDIRSRSFEDLTILHLDLCPRIIHVLPLAMPMVEHSLGSLVTLEIVWCGNLEVVFPLYTDAGGSHQHQEQSIITVELRKLERIHLHELPKLQGICGRWMISAPMLETVKIRGCWSLKRLPAVSSGGSKKVECDCEKEWWEKLEWDMGANHHPSLYKPIHSRYYKKTMLRGSVLI